MWEDQKRYSFFLEAGDKEDLKVRLIVNTDKCSSLCKLYCSSYYQNRVIRGRSFWQEEENKEKEEEEKEEEEEEEEFTILLLDGFIP